MTDKISLIDSKYYYDGELGVTLTKQSTCFAVWAPDAEAVEALIYNDAASPSPCMTLTLAKGENGVWAIDYPDSLEGKFYNLAYTYNGVAREGVDIYAKAVGLNGDRGYIADLKKTDPKGWEDESYVKLESYNDAVIYETHIRDFSSDESSGVEADEKGKYSAFLNGESVTKSGKPTCISHLVDLGVTHIHLLPAFDYEGVDETDPKASYNWGYNPKNYNVPEGGYSADPADPLKRICEFKKMVQALHKKGIGVIMDVVYNHTYESEDSWFEIAYPGYYHRTTEDGRFSNGSGCGNEMASERKMCRKYIIESVLWWAGEYKIDGFRFDLMALLDIDTLNELAKKLKEINPSVILYGEGWTGGASALEKEKAAFKQNAKLTPSYAYFNDDYRDAIKGETFNKTALGYVSGNFHLRQRILTGLLGNADWARSPEQTINYCEAHDNHTMWDKLMISAPSSHDEDRKKMARLAGALVFLAQGVPFIQAGQEMLRSKPLGDGKYDENSYSSPDSVNSVKWDMLDDNEREAEYFKGLIEFRKAHDLLRLKSVKEVIEAYVIRQSPDGTIALELSNEDETILMLINPIPRAKVFLLPEGEWQVYISDIKAGNTPMATYCEGVFVPPISAMVLIKK